jgi:N-methylhydantoinase A
MGRVISVDTGGTFTDTVLVDEDGSRTTGKASTTPDDPSEGVIASVANAAENAGGSLEGVLADTSVFFHGTTLTTNTVLERTGSEVGLLTTRGHQDAIHIGRIKSRTEGLSRDEIKQYYKHEKPDPIVPKRRIRELDERVDYKGSSVVDLDADQVREAVDDLTDGVDALAVSLLWSFRNEEHEQRIRDIAQEVAPGVPVSLSSDVAPKLGEYERTATTVVNAYTAPILENYVETLVEDLNDRGLDAPVYLMQSTGGVIPIDSVTDHAVATIDSGPVGGVTGSKFLGEQLGREDLICTDVGGTSFDVGLVVDGELQTTPQTSVQKYTLHQPAVDIESIGSGGGSVAWIDDGGALRVGPKSAGADPGPACYGRGGTRPTVTDADVLLGYIDPDYFLGGRQSLDVDAAEAAMAEHVAEPLGISVEEAAAGVFEIVNAAMADLLRKMTIERGHDPRDFTLLAYGGAGPLHAPFYGADLGTDAISIPFGNTASVYSAFGIATSDMTYVEELSEPTVEPFDPDRLTAVFERMESRIAEEQGIDLSEASVSREVELRYQGQANQLDTPVPSGRLTEEDMEQLPADFEQAYESLYGSGSTYAEAAVELVSQRVTVRQETTNPITEALGEQRGETRMETRDVYWPAKDSFVETAIHEGAALGRESRIDGPAVVQFADTTVPIRPEQEATVDDIGNIHIRGNY